MYGIEYTQLKDIVHLQCNSQSTLSEKSTHIVPHNSDKIDYYECNILQSTTTIINTADYKLQ